MLPGPAFISLPLSRTCPKRMLPPNGYCKTRQIADLLAAAKAGDTAKFEDANERWYQNADDILAFLNSANPRHWRLREMKSMMSMHLDLTLEEASARLNADWAGDVVAYDKVHDEILQMAHMLTEGIIAQFRNQFK